MVLFECNVLTAPRAYAFKLAEPTSPAPPSSDTPLSTVAVSASFVICSHTQTNTPGPVRSVGPSAFSFCAGSAAERPSRARLRSGIEVNGEVGAHGRSSAVCLLPIDTRASMGEGETISRECNETQYRRPHATAPACMNISQTPSLRCASFSARGRGGLCACMSSLRFNWHSTGFFVLSAPMHVDAAATQSLTTKPPTPDALTPLGPQHASLPIPSLIYLRKISNRLIINNATEW